MTPDEQQELTRLRQQIGQLHRLAEDWRTEKPESPIKTDCANQIDAILKGARSPVSTIWAALAALFIFALLLAFGVCLHHPG
jgi:hypothetical protein